jgi:hypothetical protein
MVRHKTMLMHVQYQNHVSIESAAVTTPFWKGRIVSYVLRLRRV